YSVTPVSGSIALSSATIPAAVRIRGMVSDMVRALLLGGRQGLGPDDGPAVIAVDTGGQQVAVTVGDLCLQVHRVQGAAPRAEGVDAVRVDGQQLALVQQVKHGQASFLHPSSSSRKVSRPLGVTMVWTPLHSVLLLKHSFTSNRPLFFSA